MNLLPLTLTASAVLWATTAQAQDTNSRLSAGFMIEFQNDYTSDSTAPGGEMRRIPSARCSRMPFEQN